MMFGRLLSFPFRKAPMANFGWVAAGYSHCFKHAQHQVRNHFCWGKHFRNSLKPQCSQGLLNVCFPDYMAKFVENCRQTNHGTVPLKPWHHHGNFQILSKQTALWMAWSSGSCWESTSYNLPWAPKNHGKIQALGHLETRLFTIKKPLHVDLGCPWCANHDYEPGKKLSHFPL